MSALSAEELVRGFRPRSVGPEAAAFAREVTGLAGPESKARAKALLFATSRLAGYAESIGTELSVHDLLSAAFVDRFILCGTAGLSAGTVRTLKTNLDVVSRRVCGGAPARISLRRHYAKGPYGPEELSALMANALSQSTKTRRVRASALVALGAGAGLVGGDLRLVRGIDVVKRSGGVVVEVRGARPRVVPVLERYHDVLLEAAAHAGDGFVVGGVSATRRNVSGPVVTRLEGGNGSRLPVFGRAGSPSAPGASGCRRSWPPPGSPAPSVSATSSRGSRRAARPPPWRFSGERLVATRPLRGDPRRLRGGARARGAHAERWPAAPAPCEDGAARDAPRPRRGETGPARVLPRGALWASEGRQGAARGERAGDRLHLPAVLGHLLGPVRHSGPDAGARVPPGRQDEDSGRGAAARRGVDAAARRSLLREVADRLVEASVPDRYKRASRSLAADWTDYETWSRPRDKDDPEPANDPDARWGHATRNAPGAVEVLFFGYYAQVATMVPDDGGEAVPELVRRIGFRPCDIDPAREMRDALVRLSEGTCLGDVLCDCGYSNRKPENFARELRRHGARLVMDLHPSDRGRCGTFEGAVLSSGEIYCPMVPGALLDLGPLRRGATAAEIEAHDRLAGELARYRFGYVAGEDADGYSRRMCPAAAGKLRCCAKPASSALSMDRPTIAAAHEHLPRCCVQQTITVPPSVNEKTRQRHPYASSDHRRSYNRRTAAERTFAP